MSKKPRGSIHKIREFELEKVSEDITHKKNHGLYSLKTWYKIN